MVCKERKKEKETTKGRKKKETKIQRKDTKKGNDGKHMSFYQVLVHVHV